MAKATRKGETLTPEINDRDHIQGSSTAAITLVEFGDFECPYSADAVDTIRVIQRSFGPRLRFVFRHFPLDKHAHALAPQKRPRLRARKASSGKCTSGSSPIRARLRHHRSSEASPHSDWIENDSIVIYLGTSIARG